MKVKTFFFLRKLLKFSHFWKENYLILREFKYFPRPVILALFFTFLAAIFEGFGVGLLMTFLQSITEPGAAPIQTGLKWFDVWILSINAPATQRLYRISTLILLTTLCRTSFTYLGKAYTLVTRSHLLHQLRLRVFDQLQSLSLSYFTKTKSGDLLNTITTEISSLREAFGLFGTLLIRGSTLGIYVISMFVLSWQLTIISLVLFFFLSVGIANLVKRIREISFLVTKANRQYTSVILEFIQGIRTIQAASAQNFEQQSFQSASAKILEEERNFSFYQSSAEPLSEAASTTILIAILIFAFATLIPVNNLSTASLLTFLFILFRLMPIVRQINGAQSNLGGFQGSLNSIKELLRTDNKTYLKNGTLEFSGLEWAIEFQSVDFGYNPSNLVLHDIHLTIERGTTTALVGSSGAGKSTLADLVPRFYDPTRGQILIDGIPLTKLDINSLRRKLSVVSQDTFIFHTSVRENIAYAMEGVNDEAIWEAAKLANALEFIQDLPQGLDTQLGDRGVQLSGGQRQRIAIARALLRDPEILILDEATSALDSVSERLIQESLERLSVGRTTIAIAHRLSTISKADKVVVLEEGRIVEQGSYDELLEQRGKLWKYHDIQHTKN